MTHIRYSCGCPDYPLFIITDPCSTKCGKHIGQSPAIRKSNAPCGLHTAPPYEPKTLEALDRAEDKVPRFLFRGFHCANFATRSGLNTQTGVYPFAYAPPQHTASYQTRAGLEAEVGIPEPRASEDDKLIPMDFQDHLRMAEHHVEFNLEAPAPSPYTSWTADFTTAIWCASFPCRVAHV
jgi:hypothetical protein